MPAKSEKQRRLMGMALSAKRGKSKNPMAKKLASQMSEKQLEEFATKKKKKGKK